VHGKLDDVDGMHVLHKLKRFSDLAEPDRLFEVAPVDEDGEAISFDQVQLDWKGVPDTIKHLMITRCRIKLAVKVWVGETPKATNAGPSGAFEEMDNAIKTEASRMNDDMVAEMVQSLPAYAPFADQLGEDPFASERKKLKEARTLIEEGIRLVKSLPNP